MQISELQAMTVIQLRKLAKENGVKLSAGIDKEGIVQRLHEAINADFSVSRQKESAGDRQAPGIPAMTEISEEPLPVDDMQALDEGEARKEREPLHEAPLSADVTSLQPAGGYRGWNAPAPQEQESCRPVYRQAWQARSAIQQRENVSRPAWQQRAAVGVNRFGPQTQSVQPSSNPPAEEIKPEASVVFEETPPRISEPVPKLDGYRLGYRAAPQRPMYQNRDNGGYPQGNYRQNNNYNNGYANNNYRQNNYRSAPSYSGYGQPTPPYPPRTPDSRFNDGVYRMGRDPQFTQQAESGQLPELLRVPEGEPAGGILEILPDGYGFLRGGTLLPGKKDIYVSVAQIRRFDLRTGDLVEGKARIQRENDKFAALLIVEKVNGAEAKENPERLSFDQMVPVYPNKRISLEAPGSDTNMVIRLVDLIAPIGFGQRAMIVAPPQSDGLIILRDISRAIKANDESAEVLMLLIDVAPEDVTEIRETANGEVFASTFADSPEMQTRVSETMLERAQRLVENGRNVVILLDSLTKLTRAYQGTLAQGGRPMNNTVTPAALVRPKRFFGAARNTREGGSLTVVATINVETGSRVDDIIFEEFKGTANMELFLLSPVPGDPIRPMIDLQRSGTKKDDMLLDEERKESLRSIRKVLGSTTNGEAVVQLIDMMKKTKCNEDLLHRLQDWVVLWEKSGYLKR